MLGDCDRAEAGRARDFGVHARESKSSSERNADENRAHGRVRKQVNNGSEAELLQFIVIDL